MAKTYSLDTIAPSDINWLWDGRIAFGALTILEGSPGLGKSYISLEIAAGVTRGRLIDGKKIPPAGVILMAAEDDISSTLVPRLNKMNADLSRIHMFDGREGAIDLAQNMGDIEEVIVNKNIKLMIIDPLSYYMGASIKSEQKIRDVLTPLVNVATKYGVAVLLIRHVTKTKGKHINNGIGGVAISALCRTGLLLDRADGQSQVTVVNFKNNLARLAEDVVYHIVNGRPVFDKAPKSASKPEEKKPTVTDPGLSDYRKAILERLNIK